MKLSNLVDNALEHANIVDITGIQLKRKKILSDFNSIKNYLLDNYAQEDIVAIYLEKNSTYLLFMLACIQIGLAYIPLRKEWPKRRIEQIQNISGCYIMDEDKVSEILNYKHISINSFDIAGDKVLYIMFTSGTTGAPKGVIIRRKSYLNYVLWMDSFYEDIDQNDRLLLTTDFTFDMSMGDIGFFLNRHVTLYISSFTNDIFQLLYELEKYKITIHRTVPYTYTMVTRYNGLERVELSSLKVLIFAGSRFPYSLYNKLKELFPQTTVYNLYGPTETTIDVTARKLLFDENKDVVDRNISVGKAITNNNIKIINNELCVNGVQVMEGYLNDQERTNAVMLIHEGEKYYKTGDLTFQDKEGNYYIIGRTDDTVKIAGFRINLLDIDAYINNFSYIHDCATVFVNDDKTGDGKLVSFLILNTRKEKKDIIEDMRKNLLSYQIPNKLFILDKFPLNPNGKVDRKALKRNNVIL